jgi:hypothetical protein
VQAVVAVLMQVARQQLVARGAASASVCSSLQHAEPGKQLLKQLIAQRFEQAVSSCSLQTFSGQRIHACAAKQRHVHGCSCYMGAVVSSPCSV